MADKKAPEALERDPPRKAEAEGGSAPAEQSGPDGVPASQPGFITAWSVNLPNGAHVWEPRSHHRNEVCGYCDSKFTRTQKRPVQCTLCHLRAHGDCLDRDGPPCRLTFREADEPAAELQHLWISGVYEQKKLCDGCNKSIGSVISTGKTLARRCAWCKRTRHVGCGGAGACDLGHLGGSIVPPSALILQRPKAGAHADEPLSRNRMLRHKRQSTDLLFEIHPPPACTTPVVVFINPKSGGNQGLRLLHEFQWLLNPRQVFDLMAPDAAGKPLGPKPGLEMFKNVPNIRVLVCGGDGTVGWVFEAMDAVGLHAPVSTLPLGTGNDLAREFNWGGGYAGLPIPKALKQVEAATAEPMDRWTYTLVLQPASGPQELDGIPAASRLPQTTINNYFSFGSDAYTALRFHLAREAKPASFDSRMRNKAHYGLLGAKEIIGHKFRNLSRDVRLICDGEDKTQLLVSKRIEAVAFLNISSYAGGTRPWGSRSAVEGFGPPSLCDGCLEVVGFEDAWEMAKGQMGLGHALRIAQCKTAVITTTRALPMQIDGEPCIMAPATITIKHKNQVQMLRHARGERPQSVARALDEAGSDEERDDVEVEDAGRRLSQDLHSDDDDLKTMDVIFVPLQGDRSGVLRRLGAVTVQVDIPLVDARSHLSSQLHISLRHAAGWRFLKFCKDKDKVDDDGAFFIVTMAEELTLRVRALTAPVDGVHPGLYVCQLPNHVDVDATPEDNFLSACMEGALGRVRASLHDGVNIESRDECGRTGLHLAAMHNRLGVVLVLLREYCVSADLVDNLGRTALHIAASLGHYRVCETLLECNASMTIADTHGLLAVTLALEGRHDDVVRLFRARSGAEPDVETVV
eukprot:m.230880 g.230880  ORF g.230880 m.230880 type:complete len:858 (-) comp12128_c0_seq1:71-2644(-)